MTGVIARGREAIHAAQEAAKGGGSFSPYLKSIFWKDDKEEHYVLFLNDIDGPDGIPTFDMVQFIEDENGHFQEVVAKTDGFFSERTDPFAEEWDATVVKRSLAIAVELEPINEVVKGRKKPVGFEVRTEEYTRKVVDEDGEVTDEEEEVTTPVIGYVVASPNTFFNHVENYDANEAPVNETAVKITRLGKDKHTSYALQGYDDQKIDLTNLLDYLDGVSYIRDDLEGILESIEGQDDLEAAQIVGQAILNKRIDELLDGDRYDKLFEGVTESMDKFGNKKKESKGKSKGKVERKTRQSQRRSQREDTEPEAADEPAEPEAKPARKTRTTKAKAAEGRDAKASRMEELRERAARRKDTQKAA